MVSCEVERVLKKLVYWRICLERLCWRQNLGSPEYELGKQPLGHDVRCVHLLAHIFIYFCHFYNPLFGLDAGLSRALKALFLERTRKCAVFRNIKCGRIKKTRSSENNQSPTFLALFNNTVFVVIFNFVKLRGFVPTVTVLEQWVQLWYPLLDMRELSCHTWMVWLQWLQIVTLNDTTLTVSRFDPPQKFELSLFWSVWRYEIKYITSRSPSMTWHVCSI